MGLKKRSTNLCNTSAKDALTSALFKHWPRCDAFSRPPGLLCMVPAGGDASDQVTSLVTPKLTLAIVPQSNYG